MDVRPALLILITNPFTSGNPKRFTAFRFLWGPRSKPSRRLFAMGRAEAHVAFPFGGAVWNIAHMFANAKVLDFASFMTI